MAMAYPSTQHCGYIYIYVGLVEQTITVIYGSIHGHSHEAYRRFAVGGIISVPALLQIQGLLSE